MFCDVDEIPRKSLVMRLDMAVFKYNFRWWRAGAQWAHPFVVSDHVVKHRPPSWFRTASMRRLVIPRAGWHCTYFLTAGDMVRKLESFSHIEFNVPALKRREYIKACMLTGRFFLNTRGLDKLEPYYGTDLPDGWQEFQAILDDAVMRDELDQKPPNGPATSAPRVSCFFMTAFVTGLVLSLVWIFYTLSGALVLTDAI
jgi:hypothetical protein